MRLDPQPLFRRVITPWYDGPVACWVVIVMMAGVLLFSLAGIVVARSNPDFHGHTWVPAILLLASLFVLLSTAVRLLRRRMGRRVRSNGD